MPVFFGYGSRTRRPKTEHLDTAGQPALEPFLVRPGGENRLTPGIFAESAKEVVRVGHLRHFFPVHEQRTSQYLHPRQRLIESMSSFCRRELLFFDLKTVRGPTS